VKNAFSLAAMMRKFYRLCSGSLEEDNFSRIGESTHEWVLSPNERMLAAVGTQMR
jgi:hypothetical protein